MQSNYLKANSFDVCSKEEGVYPLHFCFLLFYNQYLNIIVIYLSPHSVELHRDIFRFTSSHLHGQGRAEVCGLVRGRRDAWHAWESVFLLLFEGFGDILWFFPQGLEESELAWFHQPPATVYRGSV